MELRDGHIPSVRMQLKDSNRHVNIVRMVNDTIRLMIRKPLYDGHNSFEDDTFIICQKKNSIQHKQDNTLHSMTLNSMVDMIDQKHGFEVAVTIARLFASIKFS